MSKKLKCKLNLKKKERKESRARRKHTRLVVATPDRTAILAGITYSVE